jgi:hypothetical protein
MRPVAIYAAIVEDLDTPVSKSTIKNELRPRPTTLPLELGQGNHAAYFLIRRERTRRRQPNPRTHCR